MADSSNDGRMGITLTVNISMTNVRSGQGLPGPDVPSLNPSPSPLHSSIIISWWEVPVVTRGQLPTQLKPIYTKTKPCFSFILIGYSSTRARTCVGEAECVREVDPQILYGGRKLYLEEMASRISLALALLVVALAVVASGRILDGVDDLNGLEGDDLLLTDTVFTDEDADESGMPSDVPATDRGLSASFGNIVYSVIGFVLGGSLMFISLFDITRKPVIMFFDQVFGMKTNRRRRREAGYGLESRVAVAFDTLAAALDKMETIAKIANSM
ncbi:uncharacterized protein LOC134774281 [Penaeus indicus]|uniref:uncharacterized protein LOC134774281 n=1 Tax=Penaeus indicus TaxID=29960 RepID=UPI00300BFFF8